MTYALTGMIGWKSRDTIVLQMIDRHETTKEITMTSIVAKPNYSDSELTTNALAGERDAFAQIVMRYQSLVCSLAYSATGNLSQSEDLAQETFLAAWKGLRTLREPEKLRSWLCGIARNLIASAVQRKKQESVLASESLDEGHDYASSELLPVEHVISSEEESILWRSLEHIPSIYREPLVLFYREGKSIESTAVQLELSEEAVKQRLSRGRKLLKMEVAAFVESALGRSRPGQNFTAVVLAGIPELSISASASSVGTALSKSSAIAKAGLIGGMLTPIFALLGGFFGLVGSFVIGAWSTRERALSIKYLVSLTVITAIGLRAAHWVQGGQLYAPIFLATFGVNTIVCVIWHISVKRLRKGISIEEIPEGADSKRPFFVGPESKGFRWTIGGGILTSVFANPLALLAVVAAKAHDAISVTILLALSVAMCVVGYQLILRRPGKSMKVMHMIYIASFPILLIAMHLRWERWTGQTPWQYPGDALYYIAMGFLLFAGFFIHWLIKGDA
jgi:RNA polymerase sigma factor (sigma-70 family)